MAEVDFFSMVSCLKTNVLARRGSTKDNQMFSLKAFRMAIIMTVHNEPRQTLQTRNDWHLRNKIMSTEKKGNRK